MSSITEETNPAVPGSLQPIQEHWGWFLALGILMIVLGVVGLGMSFALTMASVVFFGALMLAGGIVQLIQAFRLKGWRSSLWHMLIAVLYGFAGVVLIYDPLASSIVITLLIAVSLMAVGVFRITMALQHRDCQVHGWLLFAGVISVLLGIVIIIQWPVSGLWVIGLFVALELLFHGVAYTMLALGARRERPGLG